jgi:predicted dehydrogenase
MRRRDFLKATSGAALAVALHPAARSVLGDDSLARIKVGQIGTAHAHASGKMDGMRKFSELYEVVGIVEPDDKRRAALQNSSTYSGLKWMSEDELLGTKGLQAVAVETEVRDLVPTAARCVAAGLHVHLDKPAGESLPEFKKLLDEATRRGRVIQMGYMFRYNPAFQFLSRAAKEGWLGDVFEAHGVISKTVDDGTRRKLAEYAGGSMFELGCHLIDALVAVLGKPEKVTPYVRRTQPDKDDLADNQLAVFEYPKATATIRSALVEVDGNRRRQFVVGGDKGTIDIRPLEPPRLTLTLAEPRGGFTKGTHEVELPKATGRYDGDFLDLARIIRGEKSHDYPPAHDLAVQRSVLEASGMPLG